MSSTDEPIKPARRRRWYLWLLLFLVPFLIFGAQWGIRKSHAERDLQEAIAETDRLDPGWRLAQLLAARKAIEKNSVTKILETARLLGENPFKDPRLEAYFPYRLIEQRLNAQQIEMLQDLLKKNAKAVEIARAVRDYPEGHFHFVYLDDLWTTRVLDLQSLRDVVALLDWDVRAHLHAEHPTEAAQSCLAMLYASRAINHEPMIIAQLVRWTCAAATYGAVERTLAQTQVPLAELEILQRALAEEEEDNQLLIGYRGERATLFQQLENIRSGKVSLSKVMDGVESAAGRRQELLLTLSRPDFLAVEQAECLRKMNARVEACKLPAEQIQKQMDVLEASEQASEPGILARALLTSLGSGFTNAHLRHLAMARYTQAAIAAERYRQQHKSWPGSLQELVDAGLLAALPKDPYDGKPLRLLRRADGLVIYSVYKNKQDDKAVSFRPDEEDFLDIGIQLWDVSSRRAAPMPAFVEDKEMEE